MWKLWSKKTPSFVGIRIADESLHCSVIEKQDDKKMRCIAFESIPLTNYEVVNGLIFNHVKLNKIISQFLRTHKQEQSYVIVSFDDSLLLTHEKNGGLNIAPSVLFHFSLFVIAHNIKCISFTTHNNAIDAAKADCNIIDHESALPDQLIEHNDNCLQPLMLEAIGLFCIGKHSYEENY
ncbi:MAG: hypothetical protein BWY54_00660 [Candidatus Dependentiae bacterium ADurb.Bin331]|nr:MAG: hypothetical protein BWY54_00660 [Candidatus Dependentiae bacterium ADurb.Bin331]